MDYASIHFHQSVSHLIALEANRSVMGSTKVAFRASAILGTSRL